MEICVIDFETTGMDLANSFIVEVGACKVALPQGTITQLLDTLVREDGFEKDTQLDAWIFQQTGLKREDVLRAPPWASTRQQLARIASQLPVASYSARFDVGFLLSRGIFPRWVLPCIMRSAVDVCKVPFPKEKKKYEPRYPGQQEYKWPSLQEAWNILFPQEKYAECHRAREDAIHAARILLELYRRGSYQFA